MSNSEWNLSSGLPLADADVTITGFEFGYNNDIAAGAVFANIQFTDSDGDVHQQSFSVGDGWEPANKGTELVAENGKPKKLSKNSNFGRLVQSAIEAVGADKVEHVLGMGPRVAGSWLGTRWHTTTVEVEVSAPGSTDRRKRDRIVFDQFLGREGGSTTTSAKASDTLGLPSDLYTTLLSIAKEAKDHDDFMDTALEMDGVQGVKDVEKLVMSTKAGASIWHAAGR
jgi:hypothetical protein